MEKRTNVRWTTKKRKDFREPRRKPVFWCLKNITIVVEMLMYSSLKRIHHFCECEKSEIFQSRTQRKLRKKISFRTIQQFEKNYFCVLAPKIQNMWLFSSFPPNSTKETFANYRRHSPYFHAYLTIDTNYYADHSPSPKHSCSLWRQKNWKQLLSSVFNKTV